MLNAEAREKLKKRFYPKADQVFSAPMTWALDQYLQPGVRVLDAGCGEGSWILRNHRQKIGLLVGVDVQAPKEGNKKMDEFVLSELDDLPFPDGNFDVIICYDVIEHLMHPQKVFAEFRRVLTDGGVFIFKAPCVNFPLFLLSRWTPVSWHETIKRTLIGTEDANTFPTFYRCNTARKLDRTLKAIGFRQEILESVENMYGYFTFNRIAYAISLLASRLMQSFPLAKAFRSQLIGAYRKA